MEIKQIFQILDKIRIRLSRNYLLSMLLNGLTVGGIAGCLFNFFAIFVPVVWQGKKLIGIVSGIVLLFLFYACFHLPDRKAAARKGDQCGLDERLLTAYENREQDSFLIRIQRQDTLNQAEKINWKEALRFSIKKEKFIILCISLILGIGTYWIPSFAKETAKYQEQVQKEVVQKIEETKKAEEELEKTIEDRETLDFLKKQLEEMKRELKQAKTKEQLKRSQERQMWKLKKEIKRLAEKEKLGDEERKNIMAQLERQFLNDWEQELAKENGMGQSNKEGETGEGNGKYGEKNKESGENGTNNNETNKGDNQNSQADGQGSESNGESSKSDGQGSKDSSKNNGGNGEGNGGQGNGQSGTGQNGKGKGNGKGGGWNKGNKNGEEEKALNEGNMIFVPNEEGNDKNLSGEKTNTGDSHLEEGGLSPLYTEGKVSYKQVLEQYKDEAYYKIEERNYPEKVQSVIKEYFVELNH